MATSTKTIEEMREEKKSLRTLISGSVAESIFSGAAIVLALMGLSGIMPQTLLPVAVIVMGAAFLFEGGAISIRFSKLLSGARKDPLDQFELGLGVTSEFVGGVAGVVLGILALLGMYPMVMIPAAIVVFGGTLVISSIVTLRLNTLELEGYEETTPFKKIAREAMMASAGVEILFGLGALVLGIVALGETPAAATISFAGLLVVGISGFVTGASITARLFPALTR